MPLTQAETRGAIRDLTTSLRQAEVVPLLVVAANLQWGPKYHHTFVYGPVRISPEWCECLCSILAEIPAMLRARISTTGPGQ